jgi:hypothetical protein
MNPLRDWKSSLTAIPLVGIIILLGIHAITTNEALMMLAGAATYLAAVAGDSKPKDS